MLVRLDGHVASVHEPLGTAMVARDKGSLLMAEKCRVQGAGPTAMHAQHSPSGTWPTGFNHTPTRGVSVGMEARLELKNADIVNVGYGVSVCKRSAATLAVQCTSTGNKIGLDCREQGRLHAQDCELRCFSCAAVVTSEDGGATCKLDRCRIVDPEPSPTDLQEVVFAGGGVYAYGKDIQLSMHGCTVSGTTRCVWVGWEAKATLKDCKLGHSHKGAVECSEPGSQVFLDGCEISSSGATGVLCCGGGRMVARRVHSCGNKRAGFTVHGDSSMTLKDCSSDQDWIGCAALGGSRNEGTTRSVLSGVDEYAIAVAMLAEACRVGHLYTDISYWTAISHALCDTRLSFWTFWSDSYTVHSTPVHCGGVSHRLHCCFIVAGQRLVTPLSDLDE